MYAALHALAVAVLLPATSSLLALRLQTFSSVECCRKCFGGGTSVRLRGRRLRPGATSAPAMRTDWCTCRRILEPQHLVRVRGALLVLMASCIRHAAEIGRGSDEST